jgi:hypothetical protein
VSRCENTAFSCSEAPVLYCARFCLISCTLGTVAGSMPSARYCASFSCNSLCKPSAFAVPEAAKLSFTLALRRWLQIMVNLRCPRIKDAINAEIQFRPVDLEYFFQLLNEVVVFAHGFLLWVVCKAIVFMSQ